MEPYELCGTTMVNGDYLISWSTTLRKWSKATEAAFLSDLLIRVVPAAPHRRLFAERRIEAEPDQPGSAPPWSLRSYLWYNYSWTPRASGDCSNWPNLAGKMWRRSPRRSWKITST
jgi:hypothetical protein